jgi:hypothetical protein
LNTATEQGVPRRRRAPSGSSPITRIARPQRRGPGRRPATRAAGTPHTRASTGVRWKVRCALASPPQCAVSSLAARRHGDRGLTKRRGSSAAQCQRQSKRKLVLESNLDQASPARPGPARPGPERQRETDQTHPTPVHHLRVPCQEAPTCARIDTVFKIP